MSIIRKKAHPKVAVDLASAFKEFIALKEKCTNSKIMNSV